jgi:enamine deaminase RidA (YjgF/YER057c/UK114 family)
MSKLEEKLASMGYALPAPFKYPSPNRQGCVQVGNILFVSGHGRDLPAGVKSDGAGKVGDEVTLEEAYESAKHVALSMLASLKAHCGGDLDRVKRVVRIIGMVNCTPDFELQPRVIDGASDLLYELFGPEYGCHARSAVGMGSLPHRIPVEINGEFELWRE